MAKHQKAYYLINAITFYRLIASAILIYLIFTGQQTLFAIMLSVSFFTDLIDGYLARQFNVASKFGSLLDSIADDLTFVSAVIGAFVLKISFITDNMFMLSIVFGLYLLQTIYALARYGKISSFHTYLAKIAAVLQGVFLILLFLLKEPYYPLFYSASIITILELIEEIILVYMLPEWKTNVKGLYWVINRKKISGSDMSG